MTEVPTSGTRWQMWQVPAVAGNFLFLGTRGVTEGLAVRAEAGGPRGEAPTLQACLQRACSVQVLAVALGTW